MSTTKSAIRLKFEVSPYAEMSRGREKDCRSNAQIGKIMKPWRFEETVSVNPRKWDPKSLEDALRTTIRYDLKLLDVRIGQELDRLKGGVGTAAPGALKAISGAYAACMKAIDAKIEDALNDIESDRGDDLKAIRDGKGALAKCEKFKADVMFRVAQAECRKALAELRTTLENIRKVEKAREQERAKKSEPVKNDPSGEKLVQKQRKKDNVARTVAVETCQRHLAAVEAEFRKKAEVAEAAIKFLDAQAERIAKRKDVSPEVTEFFRQVDRKAAKVFKPWQQEIKTYCDDHELARKLLGPDMKPDAIGKIAAMIGNPAKGSQTGRKLEKALKTFSTELRKIEKELK